MNRTKEEILEVMIEEMPFTLARNNKPYILEAMEIYATEKLKNHGVSHHVSDQRELFDFKNWWNNLPDESDDRLFITKGTIERFLKSNSR